MTNEDLIQIAEALPSLTDLKLEYLCFKVWGETVTHPTHDIFYNALCQGYTTADESTHPHNVIFPSLRRILISTQQLFDWACIPGLYFPPIRVDIENGVVVNDTYAPTPPPAVRPHLQHIDIKGTFSAFRYPSFYAHRIHSMVTQDPNFQRSIAGRCFLSS